MEIPLDLHCCPPHVFRQLNGYNNLDHNDLESFPEAKKLMEIQILNHPLYRMEFNGPVPCVPCGGRTTKSASCAPNRCLTYAQGFECSQYCHNNTCGNRRLSRDDYEDVMRVTGSSIGNRKKGLVARKPVEPGSIIGEFVGVLKIGKRIPNQYCVPLGERFSENGRQPLLYLDAKEYGNVARFLQTSCQLNCKYETLICGKEYRLAIVATRKIKEGEELFVEVPNQLTNETICICRSRNCAGKKEETRPTKSFIRWGHWGFYREDLRYRCRLSPNWSKLDGVGPIRGFTFTNGVHGRREIDMQ